MKNLTAENIIKGRYISVEDKNRALISKLGWGDFTDVLYSFLGIITLGLYIINKDKYVVWNNGKIAYHNNNGKVQQLGTHKNLKKLFDSKDKDLNYLLNNKYIKEFIDLYDSIGNVIPIWPGGNEFKGKIQIKNMYAYDIPDLFFIEYTRLEEIYLIEILKISVEEAALTRFIQNDKILITGIDKIQCFTLKEYFNFIKEIVEEIKRRNKEIEKLLKKYRKT